MIFPNIHNYIECKSYFTDFYELNKKAGSPISFRLLAKKLNWPFSYLSDVIHERKPLSVPRALEFAKFSNLDSIGTERLIYMCFTSFTNENLKEYFTGRLQKELNSDMEDSKENFHAGLENEAETCIKELFGDLASGALLRLLDLCHGKIKKEMIGVLLFSFEELKDMSVLDEKLKLLERNGNIKIEVNRADRLEVKVLRPVIHFSIDNSIKDISALFTEHMSRVIRSDQCSGIFNNGFIKVSKENFNEISQRMSQLRNWMLELDKEAELEGSIERPDVILFQYGINITKVMDTKSLGYATLTEWLDEKS